MNALAFKIVRSAGILLSPERVSVQIFHILNIQQTLVPGKKAICKNSRF
jgi:hypothetical protein